MATTTTSFHADGITAGRNAAGWVEFDATIAARIIAGYNSGDPEIMDYCPSPLSGEWGGESIPELFGEFPDDTDLDAYVDGFDTGFWIELIRRAEYHLD